MNHTKIIIALTIIVGLIFACSETEDNSALTIPSFVRFNFLTNSNNEPLVYPEVNSGVIPITTFKNSSINTLKIPVTLTSYTLKETVTVDYSVSSSEDNNVFNIKPTNQVSFQNNQLTDTIYVDFNERWTTEQNIVLNLKSVSDASINIGNINSEAPNDTFTINLGTIETSYTFPENRIEITGEMGEEIDFDVNFPNGYFSSEIENENIFNFLNGFDYTLTPLNLGKNKTSITYRLTLNEAINNDDVLYQTIITLNDTENYNATGNKNLQIVKPIKTSRDNAINIASNFYDLSNSFHRTYVEHWNDFNEDGICAWQSTFAFTYPVVVDATNPNAVLYDDMATVDTSDDIYHHAFQIGFDSPIATTTTNSFNLKRYFTNSATDRASSPGFNITPAIEFFPENGTSTTNGTILVIPQFLSISGKNGNSYAFAISGEGTYQEISNGIFELKFKLNITNDEVFGGTITSEYRLYNTSNYTDPENITTTNCVTKSYTL
ncbi:hypothetical protein [Polaribacter sp. 11A2H]|uniref:hypothetical protein n=1 Tax=Polaribacter sp. 11A2H TaxID=2687290 RepID=UPI00140B69C3|nr:hypothetical protein [Polaribacter sp. 11A2H]